MLLSVALHSDWSGKYEIMSALACGVVNLHSMPYLYAQSATDHCTNRAAASAGNAVLSSNIPESALLSVINVKWRPYTYRWNFCRPNIIVTLIYQAESKSVRTYLMFYLRKFNYLEVCAILRRLLQVVSHASLTDNHTIRTRASVRHGINYSNASWCLRT